MILLLQPFYPPISVKKVLWVKPVIYRRNSIPEELMVLNIDHH